jgi:hypothetical protein
MRRRRRQPAGATPVPALGSSEGDRAAGLPLTIQIAAERSPAAAGAVRDPVTKALVGVLNTDDESDQKARTCRARPFAPPARSDQRDRKREADVALLADQVVAA